jgi:hypothetical protein
MVERNRGSHSPGQATSSSRQVHRRVPLDASIAGVPRAVPAEYDISMRLLLTLLVTILLTPLFAQQPPPAGGARPRPAPKNLKLLEPANLMSEMHFYESALGVKCAHCHVQGDFASDAKPEKETARKMIVMAREINAKYFSGGNEGGSETAAASAHESASGTAAGAAGSATGAAAGTAVHSDKMRVSCYTCHHGAAHPVRAAAAGSAAAPAPPASPTAAPPAAPPPAEK